MKGLTSHCYIHVSVCISGLIRSGETLQSEIKGYGMTDMAGSLYSFEVRVGSQKCHSGAKNDIILCRNPKNSNACIN